MGKSEKKSDKFDNEECIKENKSKHGTICENRSENGSLEKHTGEPYKGKVCLKEFSCPSNLTIHMRTQRVEKS